MDRRLRRSSSCGGPDRGPGLHTVVRVGRVDGWLIPTKGERRRDELLRAGVDLLLERGWSSLTARGVAERAGTTPSLVGYHFGSQWRLRSQVVDVVLEEVFSPSLDEVVRHPSWQLGLAAVLRGRDDNLEGLASHGGHQDHGDGWGPRPRARRLRRPGRVRPGGGEPSAGARRPGGCVPAGHRDP